MVTRVREEERLPARSTVYAMADARERRAAAEPEADASLTLKMRCAI